MLPSAFGLFVFSVYLLSNPKPAWVYQQTLVIARALLDGSLGIDDPRPWLELVPGEESHYSVFPIGAVLSFLPLALLLKVGLLNTYPAQVVVALIALGSYIFAYLIAKHYTNSRLHIFLPICFLLFGNWMWCNLIFAGAWQLALGFSVLGQMGALYFILVRYRPIIAGAFFALAFGNRTELLVIAPMLVVLLISPYELSIANLRMKFDDIVRLAFFPILLFGATLLYNFARFRSLFDFGYERIPYVFDQPGFEEGLFSLSAIWMNAKVMLFTPFRSFDRFPYFSPQGFGECIFLCSPYLVFLFQKRKLPLREWSVAWASIVILTLVLWCHGNAGAYQYGYRYGMILLPWMFLLLISSPNKKIDVSRLVLLGVSVILSVYSVYAFYWGKYV